MRFSNKKYYIVVCEGYVEHDSTGSHGFRTTDLILAYSDEHALSQVHASVRGQLKRQQREQRYPAYSYTNIEVLRVDKTEALAVALSEFIEA